jgi:hypothetical protein
VPVVEEALDSTKKKNKMKMNKKKMIIMINVLMMTPSPITEVILAVATTIFSQPLADSTILKISRPLKLAASVVEETSREALKTRVDLDNHSYTNQEVPFLC